MPRIELIPEVLYGPNDPIHWEIDNLPLKNILRRQNLINLALDDVVEQMRDAIGTQGSVANRLNQSLNPDGSLKSVAIDEALHSIEEHEDTDLFVRMTKEQSDKLDNVADNAKDIALQIYSDETTFTEFSDGIIKIMPSPTVTPSFEAPDTLKLNLSFPVEAAHRHYYGLEPVHSNLATPDYVNYKVNSAATAFVEGSLRVYINGVRLYQDADIYIPGEMVDDAWTLLSFTEQHEAGTFQLSSAISEGDMIRIDFDISLT